MMFPKPQRRRKSKGRTAKAALHLEGVKRLPCVVCGRGGPSDAHHVFHDRYSQNKSSDYAVIPLCKAHHQVGPDAIHNDKSGWLEKYGPDHSYISMTLENLGVDIDTDF